MDILLHTELNQTIFVLDEQLQESWHQAPDNEGIITHSVCSLMIYTKCCKLVCNNILWSSKFIKMCSYKWWMSTQNFLILEMFEKGSVNLHGFQFTSSKLRIKSYILHFDDLKYQLLANKMIKILVKVLVTKIVIYLDKLSFSELILILLCILNIYLFDAYQFSHCYFEIFSATLAFHEFSQR